MSRIGKQPIEIPEGVEVTLAGPEVSVKGPKGLLAHKVSEEVEVARENGAILVRPKKDDKRGLSQWGLQRTLLANLVEGVTKGFERRLQISGVGFRARAQGRTLNLQLGYSHDIDYPVPEGVEVTTPTQTEIVVAGIDKQLVGQVAAEIRAFRKPEPYKGKGVRYADEYVYRKEGKKK